MKKIITVIMSLTITALVTAPALAEGKTSDPNLSIGFGLTGGLASAWQHTGEGRWDAGYNFGAGLILEKMFTSRLGIHTGFWYIEARADMHMDNMKIETILRTLTLPLYLLVSANKGIFSLNFLFGVDISQIIESRLHTDDPGAIHSDAYITQHLRPSQIGIAMGFNFKFRVRKFVDLFFGVIGDFYATNLMKEHDNYNDYAHLYDARLTMGVLFRTNIFPIPEK